MAHNPKYAVALKNARLDAITSAIGASGFLDIYDGSQPANPDTAVTSQVILARLPLSATFAPAASGGVLTANAITDDTSADASGTAAWFRIVTSGGTPIVDGTVGTSGADCNLNSVTIAAGQTVEVTSLTITHAN